MMMPPGGFEFGPVPGGGRDAPVGEVQGGGDPVGCQRIGEANPPRSFVRGAADERDLAPAHVGEDPVAAVCVKDVRYPVDQVALGYPVERQTHPRSSQGDAPGCNVDMLPADA